MNAIWFVCAYISLLCYLSDTVTGDADRKDKGCCFLWQENSSIPSAAVAVSVNEVESCGEEGSEKSAAYLNWSAVGGSGGLL